MAYHYDTSRSGFRNLIVMAKIEKSYARADQKYARQADMEANIATMTSTVTGPAYGVGTAKDHDLIGLTNPSSAANMPRHRKQPAH